MERRIRERLIGASVLVMLAVIFIPMMLDNSGQVEQEIIGSNIPPRPEGGFTSRIVPLPGKDRKTEGGAGAVQSSGPEIREPAPASGAEPGQPPASISQEAAEPADTAPVASAVQPQAPAEVRPLQAPGGAEPAPPAPGAEDRVGMMAWVVQLGSFSSEVNARALSEKARKSGFSAFVEPLSGGKGTAYRVRVGPELRRSDAIVLRDRLKSVLGVEGIIINYP